MCYKQYTMEKSLKITEKEINRLVKKIVNEQDDEFIKADEYAYELREDMRKEFITLFRNTIEELPLKEMILHYQNNFKMKYPQYVGTDRYNEEIDLLMDISTDFNYDDIAFYLSEHLMEILIDEIYKMSEE